MVFYRVAVQQRPGLLLKSGFSLTRVEHGGSGAVGSTCCVSLSASLLRNYGKNANTKVCPVLLCLWDWCQPEPLAPPVWPKPPWGLRGLCQQGLGHRGPVGSSPHHCYLQAPSLCGTALGSQVSVQTCFEVLGLLFGKTKYMQPAVFSASILLSAYCFY